MSNVFFRTKFLNFVTTEESRNFWSNEFSKFLGTFPSEARQKLFELHMCKEHLLDTNQEDSKFVEKFQTWLQHFPSNEDHTLERSFQLLSNELVSQYRQANPGKNFLQRDTAYLSSTFVNLKEATNEAVAVEVFDKCNAYTHDLARVLYLLKHSEEKYYFGGLREIGFTHEEAASLKRYHLLIADMFEKVSANEVVEHATAIAPPNPHNPSTTQAKLATDKMTPAITELSKPACEIVELPLRFVIENTDVLKELENYPLLITLLSRESMDIQELFNFLGEMGNKLPNCKCIFKFLADNFDTLKGQTTATIEAALARANDPATLQAALRAAYNKP